MKRTLTLLLSAMLYMNAGQALDVPVPSQFDQRVKYVDYNVDEVVKVVGHYGYATVIEFSSAEEVVQVAAGFPEAWKVLQLQNRIFVKPVGEDAETNLIVLTNRHLYNFELDAHESQTGASSNDMYFRVTFRYPDQLARAKELAKKSHGVDEALQERHVGNTNYWFDGNDAVKPTKAWDDGRFTYIEFPGRRDLPVLFFLSEDGEETLVNSHMEENVVVIHHMAERYVVRRGQMTGTIFNKSFNAVGEHNTSGTVNSAIKREVR